MVLDWQLTEPLLEKDEQDSAVDNGGSFVNRGATASSPKRANPPSRLLLWCWLGALVIFVVAISTLVVAVRLLRSSQQLCGGNLSTASPALSAVSDRWEWRRFNGTIHSGGPFRGPPTDDVLARWAELAAPSAFSIDHQTLMDIGGSPDSVRIPEHLGGGYMAILEVHHQLHCLSELWKNTWPELYHKDAGNASATFRHHLDHCADILRQQLMCNGDVSVIPQNWVKRDKLPTPNFNVWRKCRSYEAITTWEAEHVIMAPGGRFEKPADAVQLDEFP